MDISGGRSREAAATGSMPDEYSYAEAMLDISGVTVTGNNSDGIYLYLQPFPDARFDHHQHLRQQTGRGIYLYAHENYNSKPRSEMEISGNTIDGTGSGDRAYICTITTAI